MLLFKGTDNKRVIAFNKISPLKYPQSGIGPGDKKIEIALQR